MALARAFAISLIGLEATKILIEADISATLPAFILVGLPDASLSEAPARVRAACKNSKLELPARKITVNLSPASVQKHGSAFDLGIAMAVLAAAGLVNRDSVARCVHIGELALDGSLRGVRGVIPMVVGARDAGFERVVVPEANAREAMLIPGIRVVAASHLTEVARNHGAEINQIQGTTSELEAPSTEIEQELCFSEVRGQEHAVEAAIVAAAGGHHMSLIGTPGCGKTMIAQRISGVLPKLSQSAALTLASIRSLATGERFDRLDFNPPFVAPHHSSSMVALVGGGSGVPKPGLISRATGGILFLDEAPEFSSQALDSLRQPLESGEIQLARANYSLRYPAKLQLVLAANPCPCGKAGSTGQCQCSEVQKVRYLGRISGPLLDRIDIQLRMNPARPESMLSQADVGKTTSQIAELVQRARMQAGKRLAGTPWKVNAEIPGAYLRKQFRPDLSETALLDKALTRGQISMRGYDKCLRLAWTIADLAEHGKPTKADLDFALWLRGFDTQIRSAA